jgi:hypothetical protein
VYPDGLSCVVGIQDVGCRHQPMVTGSGKPAVQNPAFQWANTLLANLTNSVAATDHAIRAKHVPRYLAQFQYRFNRRYRLGDMRPLWHGWRCAPRQCRTVSSSWLRFVGNQEGCYRRRPDQPCPKCGMPCGSAVSCPVQACPSKEAPKPNIQRNKACPLGGVEGGTPVAGSIRGAPPPTMIPVSPAPMWR